ncbi:MAG: PorV/PorQ family protein [candidate division WOR-3 bacterium]|nr:PorV/PorQ family protein [candidate division WOR-3 bacterium]
MAKKMIIGMVVGIIVLISFPLYGAASQAGAIFLAIYPGARPNGMGTCFTAIADDAMATYYNDAGMAFQDKTDITLMHANWLPGLYPDMYYEYVGGIHEFPGIGKIGANFTYLTTGTTVAVDEKGDPIPGGVFSSFDLAVKLSYATKLYEDLSIGVGGKLIYSYLVPRWIIERIWGMEQRGGGTGTSWAIDLSMFYKTYLDGLNIGLSLQNIGPNISYLESGGSDPLPRTFRLGIAYSPIHTQTNKLTLTTELTKILVGITRDINDEWEDTWKGIGIEYTLSEFLSVRGGYFWDTVGERVGPTFGGGIRLANFEFDIGVDSEIYDFPTNNYRLSLYYSIMPGSSSN